MRDNRRLTSAVTAFAAFFIAEAAAGAAAEEFRLSRYEIEPPRLVFERSADLYHPDADPKMVLQVVTARESPAEGGAPAGGGIGGAVAPQQTENSAQQDWLDFQQRARAKAKALVAERLGQDAANSAVVRLSEGAESDVERYLEEQGYTRFWRGRANRHGWRYTAWILIKREMANDARLGRVQDRIEIDFHPVLLDATLARIPIEAREPLKNSAARIGGGPAVALALRPRARARMSPAAPPTPPGVNAADWIAALAKHRRETDAEVAQLHLLLGQPITFTDGSEDADEARTQPDSGLPGKPMRLKRRGVQRAVPVQATAFGQTRAVTVTAVGDVYEAR